MAILLVHIPATAATRKSYEDKLNFDVQELLGWPCIATNVWNVVYIEESTEEMFAAPGNGDKRLTMEIIDIIRDRHEATDMDIHGFDGPDIPGFTRVYNDDA